MPHHRSPSHYTHRHRSQPVIAFVQAAVPARRAPHHALLILFAALLLVGSVISPLQAQTPEEKGLAIAKESISRDDGFKDMTSKTTMVLQNRAGKQSKRYMEMRILEVPGDGDKSLSIFRRPKDVQGTAMLTFTHPVKPDDQWMYLPALKRVKRISSRNKSGPYMGSEFAFEDLGSQEVAKYTYRWLKDETVNGQPCFVVERKPAYKYSGYTKQITWIDKKEYRILKTDFYDRKGSRLKTLYFKKYKQYLGKFWRSLHMQMVNHQNGKKTDLYWGSVKFQTGLSDRDFNKKSLKRVR